MAGSAQKRDGQAFLQHGSIPLEMDLPLLGKVLKADINAETAGSLDKVGWLNKWAGQPLTVAEVEACIVEEFSKAIGSVLKNSRPTVEELDEAERLRCVKYAHSDWNMMR